MASDPFELCRPTAEGILRWVETSRETSGANPAREAVGAYVEARREDGLIRTEDQRQVRASGYA
jgi:hypothetical protein